MSSPGDYVPLANPRRRRVYAQLRSWVAHDPNDSNTSEASGQVVINFPAMPETIELARRANYVNTMATSPAAPDGYHIYRSTDPLKIPLKFTIHSFDRDYVTAGDGPAALLQIAARLHALALPIFKRGEGKAASVPLTVEKQGATSVTPPATPATAVKGGAQPAESTTNQSQQLADVLAAATSPNEQRYFFPAPCNLNILFAHWRNARYGIFCHGFIEDVMVVLRGPWLQGSVTQTPGPGNILVGGDLDELRNLPSSVDYSFTFVHQPGYTNNFQGGALTAGQQTQVGMGLALQAMASDVYERLYNQIDLGKLSTAPEGLEIPLSAIDLYGDAYKDTSR